ncbi:DUF1330 domain-containing protein [Polymorphobacter sp.]|uniref:DUF1330 domain-containing protein n=1 Tax=Polymorphobacter sp. TaxID=1909290 RepID=UPI003F72CDE2
MRRLILSWLIAAPVMAQAPPGTPPHAPPAPGVCDDKPVIMLVAGDITDRERVLAYGKAIRDSGLYDKLGGYYMNVPRVIDTFEGTPGPRDSMLMVRFPCLAHARAFWYSKEYQEKLKPLRLNPSAGTFTVTVYPEAAPPPGVAAWWPAFGTVKPSKDADLAQVPQIKGP